MPTRKQKRRREKDRRHEYEYVYVDEEGQEVEVDEEAPEAAKPSKSGTGSARAGKPKGTGGRMLREPPVPSWSRSIRRAVPWQIGIFVLVVLVLRNSPLGSRIAVAILYGAMFVPLMYLTDRMMRNRWLKQQGRLPAKEKRPKTPR